ncbi:MAG: phosphate signaling complex protein PhoU [Deltaproteobacteria bacterium]|jgi:phosphate transport system protein|nr:phosphate signaling complex protein PhoU [Deltaproteobacteria bacterium]
MKIRKRFGQELEDLKIEVLRMAALTERSLGKSFRALFEHNSDLAEEVITEDQEIDLLEVDIDKRCLRLFALEQPMARDLRFIIGCMRVCTNLERIADQAVNISERALYLNQRPALPHQPLMEQLATTSMAMLKGALSAFNDGQTSQASEVCQMDDRADELNLQILKHFIDYIIADAKSADLAVNTIIISRCLERCADLATNIAEAVVFIVEGVEIKHYCEP